MANIRVTPEEIQRAKVILADFGATNSVRQLGELLGVTGRRARTILEKIEAEGEALVDASPSLTLSLLPKGQLSKAYQRRQFEVQAVKAEIESLKEAAKQDAVSFKPLHKAKKDSGYMLEIVLADTHVGKLCYGLETGSSNYDSRIAESVIMDSVNELLARIPSNIEFDEIVLPLLGDILHTDNTASTTTAGTPQDVDGRYHKVFLIVRKMLTSIIDRLKLLAPVRVIIIPGNHDTLAVWHLGDSLECLYFKDPNVSIDNSITARKYYQFGKVMLMLTHGDKGKLDDYPITAATEQPAMFGSCEFREVHTGHKHQTAVTEIHGVKVRIFPSLSPPDAWHAANFYTGMKRECHALIWDREEGLVATAIHSVRDVES